MTPEKQRIAIGNTNDLNAMHVAESGLDGNQMIIYQAELSDITVKNPHVACWDLIHATAAQRAEALLRTILKTKTPIT